MDTHPYHQGAAPGAPDAPDAPATLRWLVAVFGALVVVLIALPVLMTVDRGFVTESILRGDPSLTGDQLQFAVGASLAFSWGLHVVYAAVGLWLVVKVLVGRRWARIALTVLMVLATANSIDSAMQGPEYYGWVIVGDVLQVAIIVLLWAPRTTRDFFARHRALRGRTGDRTTGAAA